MRLLTQVCQSVRYYAVVVVCLFGTHCYSGHSTMPEKSERRILAHVMLTPESPPLSPCERWTRQLSDRSQPLPVRIEAVESLNRECRDHRTWQTFRGMVDQPNEELAIRGAIVRGYSRWEENFLPLIAVVHALNKPGLRLIAIETLDKIGPVSGQKEKRLAELSGLKPGASKQLSVYTIPSLFGRDPRALQYLRDLLRTGNRWERALAASVLCGLGEVQAAFAVATDPEPRVRKSLAATIGAFREERGLHILERLLDDPEWMVAQEASQSLVRLGVIGKSPARPADHKRESWLPLLHELSEFQLTDGSVRARVSPEKVSAGWLGEPGATESQIEDLERRIGRRLPPSYRSFLAASNGFQYPDGFIPRLYAAGEVDRFDVHNREWVEAYRETYPDLGSYLQLSEVGDSAVVLLNPGILNEDGEWETHFFANWNPAARPYASFREFMQNEIEKMCEWKGN